MKKFLLIILSLILIIFSGCAPTDKQEQPDINEKEELMKLLESDRLSELDITELSGNVTVEKAYVIRAEMPRTLSCYESFVIENGKNRTDKITVYDEKELYPDTAGEYFYLFFDLRPDSSSISTKSCNSVTFENQVLSIDLTTESYEVLSDDLAPTTIILKLQKSSLDGSVESLEIGVENVILESPYEIKIRNFIQNHLNNTDTCDYSYVPKDMGNIEIAEIFLWSSVNTDTLPYPLLEFDDDGKLKHHITFDESEINGSSADEYLYWCFTYQGDTLI